LEGHGIALVKGALEGISLAAFVCAKDGRVETLTSQAEALVRRDRGLTLRNQCLRAARAEEDRSLSDAIARVAGGPSRPAAPTMRAVIVHGVSAASAPLVLDVMPLPSRALDFHGGARVFVVVRGARGVETRKAAILRALYGFSPSETEIALLLARGKTAEAIAHERQVTVNTVRTQIKSLLVKLRVSRQAELVAKLSEL
jgi:DNA-binding CsgD family transcriptional regulator